MCMEAILEQKTTLVFCSTKADVERNALCISRYIQYMINKGEKNRFKQLNQLLKPTQQRQIADYFGQKTLCTDKDLLGCITYGVAFHHAGIFFKFSNFFFKKHAPFLFFDVENESK